MNEGARLPDSLRLLTPQELANALGVKVQTLAAWRVHGHGPPAVYLGRRVMYREETVAAWLREREHASTAAAGHVA